MRLLDRQDDHCQSIVFASWSPSPFNCDGTFEESCQASASHLPGPSDPAHPTLPRGQVVCARHEPASHPCKREATSRGLPSHVTSWAASPRIQEVHYEANPALIEEYYAEVESEMSAMNDNPFAAKDEPAAGETCFTGVGASSALAPTEANDTLFSSMPLSRSEAETSDGTSKRRSNVSFPCHCKGNHSSHQT
ncbi:hypothetical protein Taro_012639 [Colocasia esculenta]|uniref:Uncharacterized protein n=1 Tax=Colocasia esculenta TaxID=4460 RepID=A0A843UE25_COLES|nr:hypothetical protein [Colocasia esculenta]